MKTRRDANNNRAELISVRIIGTAAYNKNRNESALLAGIFLSNPPNGRAGSGL
jgi:hypothetical protein